jgi:hypothetical protein
VAKRDKGNKKAMMEADGAGVEDSAMIAAVGGKGGGGGGSDGGGDGGGRRDLTIK